MIIDWKEIALNIYNEVASEISEKNMNLSLKVILVWDNEDSKRYIAQKEKWAKHCGIKFELIHLKEDTTEADLIKEIEKLNKDTNITGYLVQMPLPKHIDEQKIISCIAPEKDVDWFHEANYWKVAIWDDSAMKPCTPFWVMEMLKSEGIELNGKNVVVLWRSNIVWKPMALMLINAGATVTVCNSRTKNVNFFTKNADIVITAIGKPEFLKKEMIWEHTIVIDVWFTVVDWKIYWDADFPTITQSGNRITPVPGGVGPMTVAMIMKNLIKAYEIQNR